MPGAQSERRTTHDRSTETPTNETLSCEAMVRASDSSSSVRADWMKTWPVPKRAADVNFNGARPNRCWSMDVVSEKLADGRSFRILTVGDQFTRECVWLEADRSMTLRKVTAALTKAAAERHDAPMSS